jgi:hypothetical protein
MMKRLSVVVTIIIVLATAGGSAFATPDKANSSPKKMPAAGTPSAENSLSGKVVETMNAGGYTYVCIQKKGKKTWAAIPQTTVTVGQNVSVQPGQEMTNFSSKTLNRTFESIIFSGGLVATPAAAAEKKKSPGDGHAGAKAAAPTTTDKISVEKAPGPDAYTVAEVFAQSKKLDKKTAVVRAKVVKVSAGIMGKNWVHLQDGSGDSAMGTSDLVVTSQDLPEVGTVVTMKGTVSKDKDFGAGYTYKVIMEEASIQK